ncbi:porin [Telluria mixta]|uniref:Porin n=1 Tax=Telluria mixta TaxID=34071 RepID=A0ABT2BS66_9BURK|nr:porin [Telluria mixta]MCS0627891.1 porin [Telluria mixta]WEM93990.1 porin [Telluria mixta]
MKSIAHRTMGLMCALAASGANAQTVMQVYGLIDTGMVWVNNVDVQGRSFVKMPSLTSTFPSLLGFRSTEDLDNGLQAFYVLENGLMMDTGSAGQGGRLFGRQALVGLLGAWGTLTLGRQLNMTSIATIKTDVLGPHLFSVRSIDAYLANARSDNAIGYLGNFNGIVVGATWSFGRDGSAAGGPTATNCPGEVPGNAKACRQYTGLLGYETKDWGLNGSYDRMYGNSGAAGGLTSSANTDTRTTINGFLVLGATKIGGGVIERETRAATGLSESNLYYLGVSYPIGVCAIDAQVARRDTKHSSSEVAMLVGRLTYSLSKRSAVYTSIGRMVNKGSSAVSLDAGGTVAPGLGQNGVMAGLRHTF